MYIVRTSRRRLRSGRTMGDYWQRFARQRVARRTVLRTAGTGAAAVALAGAVGCKTASNKHIDQPPTPSTDAQSDGPDLLNATGTPRRGGRLRSSAAAEFGSFDPHIGISLASAYFPRLYNVLVNQAAPRPNFMYFDLASSLETPDPQTFVFKIRPGVKVTPNDMGVPERDLTAEDVRANIERIASTNEANNYNFAHNYIAGVDVAGDTATIRTTRPYAWFINRIGLWVNSIAPRELLEGNTDRLASQAAGAGPYRLTKLTEGSGAKFDRNPNYYRRDDATGEQLPYVDGLDLSLFFDRSAARTAFVTGQIDQYTPSGSVEAEGLADSFVIQRDPNFSFIAFTMNPQQKPFDDPRVRRAFSRAINRQQYIDIAYAGEARPDGLVHWSVGDYALNEDELATKYQPFDLDEAKRLVQQVGGIKVRMMYPADTLLEEHDKHLPVFLNQMKAAGIEIDSDPQPLPTWIDNFTKLNYQCSLSLNQFYETPEIPLGFHTAAGPLGDHTYVQGIGDPEIEAAVRKATETLDLAARIEAVHEAQKVIYSKDPAFLPLVTPYTYQAYWEHVHNIPAGVGTTAYLLNMFWLDRST